MIEVEPSKIPDSQKGYYVPATGTFYTVLLTDFTKETHMFAFLKKKLMKNDVLDFHKSNLSGNGPKDELVKGYQPQIITAKVARQKELKFEIYFATEMDRVRYEEDSVKPAGAKPLFKKQTS